MYAYFISHTGLPIRVLLDADGDYDSAEAWADGQFVEASVLISDILMKGEGAQVSETAFRERLVRRAAHG